MTTEAQKEGQTPRTDAQPPVSIYDCQGQQYDSTLVDRDFARQLERESSAHASEVQRLRGVAQTNSERVKMLENTIKSIRWELDANVNGDEELKPSTICQMLLDCDRALARPAHPEELADKP